MGLVRILEAATLAGSSLAVSFVITAECPAQELLKEFQGRTDPDSAGDRFGSVLAAIGDVDGDGTVDFAVSASGEEAGGYVEHGAVYAISGATGETLYKFLSDVPGVRFGETLASGSEFDRDGIGDFIIGCPMCSQVGKAIIVSGCTGEILFQVYGETITSQFGSSVASFDDLDGDGTDDFGAGAPGYDEPPRWEAGRAYVFSGATGAILYSKTGIERGDNTGTVCRLGDLNGDGIHEVGIGSPGGGANDEGLFEICDGPTGTAIRTHVGEARYDRFGSHAAGLGDVDGDRIDDYAVKAEAFDADEIDAGKVYVFSGATGEGVYEYHGTLKYQRYGSLPTNGHIDFNCDGFADIAIGAATDVEGLDLDSASIYSGRTGKLLYAFRAEDFTGVAGGLGSALTSIGDLDGDGADDLLLGAPLFSDPYGSAGRVFLHGSGKLFLQSDQQYYGPGEPITLKIRGGEPQVLAMIVLVDFSGIPWFTPLLFETLNNLGQLKFEGIIPPEVAGEEVTFVGFAQASSSGGSVDTLPELVVFQ